MADSISGEPPSWDALLTPLAQLKLAATKSARAQSLGHPSTALDTDQLTKILQVTDEIRDRYRHSQNRLQDLKSELARVREQCSAEVHAAQQSAAAQIAAAQQAAASQIAAAQQAAAEQLAAAQEHHKQALQRANDDRARERAASDARLAGLEADLHSLSHGVLGQAAALDSQAEEARTLRAELAQAQRLHRTAESETQDVLKQLEQAKAARDKLYGDLDQLKQQVTEAEARYTHLTLRAADTEARAAGAEGYTRDLKEALTRSKARIVELAKVESLYQGARDEIRRLEKENSELKDMVLNGQSRSRTAPLHTSRVLESASASQARGTDRPRSPGRRAASPTRVTAKSHMGRIHVARDLLVDLELTGTHNKTVTASPPHTHKHTSAGADRNVSSLPSLAWLGPTLASYPPDPDHFEYTRVGGGYMPQWAGTSPRPKLSGWVPKDVVRIIQAFKREYRITNPDWLEWEKLLLLIDEVYKGQTGAAVAGVRAASAGRVCTARRKAQELAAYPSVLQASRIAHLKRQLDDLRRHLADVEKGDEHTLRRLVEKQHHLIHQLETATDTSATLRNSLYHELDDLGLPYSSAE